MLRLLARLPGLWLLGAWIALAGVFLPAVLRDLSPGARPAVDSAAPGGWDSLRAAFPPPYGDSLRAALDSLEERAKRPSPALDAAVDSVATAIRPLILVALAPWLVLGLLTLAWLAGRWRYREPSAAT